MPTAIGAIPAVVALTFGFSAVVVALADEPNPARGHELFGRACAACHSLSAGKNMTGPTLHGLWNRQAGSVPSFSRYSPALKSSAVVWSDDTLDRWLADPRAFVPGNRMIFNGIPEKQPRADLIAFLKAATQPSSKAAQAGVGMGGMMGMGAEVPNLKKLSPNSQVREIQYCGDTYNITTADGETEQFWERNLRFKTDSSQDGPQPMMPAILSAGMVGDRASVIFAGPEEFAKFIKRTC
jgi:cytochrome c